jgi:hypothetical protein
MAAPKGNTNSDIKFDKRNYRKHPDKNKKIIKKSLDEFGAGRSILIDSENEIIAGNGVAEAWDKRPIRIIETDGKELIAIKRTDLKTKDEKRKQLALIDNHSSDTSELDIDLIQEDFSKDLLEDFDIEINEPQKKIKQELKAYKKHHILISYPPDLHTEIISLVENICNINSEIEIESGSN